MLKRVITTLLFAICCCGLQAKSLFDDHGEQAYMRLQAYSVRGVTIPATFSEDSLLALARTVEIQARADRNLGREFKAGQIQVNAYALSGSVGSAVSRAQQLLEKAYKTEDPLALGLSIQAIGDTYMHAGRFEQADSIFAEAMPYINRSGDKFMRIQLMIQQLHVFANLHHIVKTHALLHQAHLLLAESPQISGSDRYLFLLNVYGAFHALENNNTQRAVQLLDGLKSQKFDDAGFVNIINYVESLCNMAQGNYDVALGYSELMLSSMRSASNKNAYLKTLTLHASLQESTGDMKAAIETYYERLEISDSLFRSRYLSQVDSLHVTYMVDTLQIKNITRRNNLYSMVIWTLVAFVGMTIGVVLLIRRQNHSLKAYNRELISMREASANSIRSKSLFLSNMSQELRTPLNAILGFSEILTDGENSDDETRSQCEMHIRQNADLLIKLFDDVVDLSGLSGDTLRFVIAPYDVVRLCGDVMGLITKIKRPEVSLEFETSLDELVLDTDSSRLRQVLINLLVNASKFTKSGSIKLRLYIDTDHDQALFVVEDTGCGISAQKQVHIFDRFEKTNDAGQGAGLGLSICKLIVNHTGGSIWIDSTYTLGTRFMFTHPLHLTNK